jgi:hypothetical protein
MLRRMGTLGVTHQAKAARNLAAPSLVIGATRTIAGRGFKCQQTTKETRDAHERVVGWGGALMVGRTVGVAAPAPAVACSGGW